MAPLALLSNLTTRLHHMYSYIALLASSVSIEFVSSSARVKFAQVAHLLSEREADQGHLGPIKIEMIPRAIWWGTNGQTEEQTKDATKDEELDRN